MSDIPAGRYKARAVKGSEQYLLEDGKAARISILLDVPSLGKKVTVFLPITQQAYPFSFDKLRTLGWDGKSASDLESLETIDKNEVEVDIRYKSYQGKQHMNVDIVANKPQSNFKFANAVDKSVFMAKVLATLGNASVDKSSITPSPMDDIPF